MTWVRPPSVAGRFYPGDRIELEATVDARLAKTGNHQPAFGCIVPHAGYVYSGHVAGAVYGALDLPHRFMILGPNHRGQGQPLATTLQGAWATPLGNAVVDEELAHELVEAMPSISNEEVAHRVEHSIEVQLPFLQCAVKEFTFVPISVGTSDVNTLLALGDAIAGVIHRAAEPTLIVCSSDMNHYEPDDLTRIKDAQAIAPMLALDAAGLYAAVRGGRISMCGFAPAVATLRACAQLGAKEGRLIRYATSGDVNGDRSYVVGYAGIALI